MTTATTANASDLLLVDSSGWLEYLTEDLKASDFAPYIEGQTQIVVPTIVLYEVYKKLWLSHGKKEAERFASQALRRLVVPLDEDLALSAAKASVEHRLAMADAIIYATARSIQAELITSDPHFQSLPGVKLI